MSRPSTLQNHPPVPYSEEHASSLSDARLRRIVEIWRDPGLEREELHLEVMDLAERRIQELGCEATVWPEAYERAQHQAERWARLRHVGLCLLHMPWLDRLFCTGRLSWEQVDVLARVISPPHEMAWIDQALALDLDSLRTLVDRSPRGGPPNTEGAPVARPRRMELDEGAEATSLAVARRDGEHGGGTDVKGALVRRRVEAVDGSARLRGARGAPSARLDRPTARGLPTEGEASVRGAAWVDARAGWVRLRHARSAGVGTSRLRAAASSHARTPRRGLRTAPNVRRRRRVNDPTA